VTDEKHTFRVRWYQRKFHEALVKRTHDRLIAIWHRRAGKDEIVINAMRELALKDPGTYWHCFPEQKQARKAIWNGVNGHTGKRRIFEAFPQSIIRRMQDDDMFLELVNGATFQLIGSDRYDSTVGSGPKGIAYSEWALSNPSAWAYHSPMIRESGGFAAFITTPRGGNHAKTMYDRALKTPDTWFAELLTIGDTQALTSRQLKEALEEYQDLHGEELGLALYEQEYDCSFSGAMVGSYWGGAMNTAERQGRLRFVPVDPAHPVHTAWDLGKAVNNPIWCFQVIYGQLRIVDFYLPADDDLDAWCDWLNEQGYHGDDYVPDDILDPIWGAKHTRWDLLKAKKRKPKLVKRIAVADGIYAGREAIKAALFHKTDHPDDERAVRVEHGMSGLRSYRREWDDERKTFLENPFKDWAEHIGSSWRYLGLVWRAEYAPVKPKDVPTDLRYEARADGSIVGNMSVKAAVDAMVRRRRARE
jgi:phage terminase large subunit